MVPRRQVAFEFALMTSPASVVADKPALIRCACPRCYSRVFTLRPRNRSPNLRLLPPHHTRKTQSDTNDQKCRPNTPPWKLRSQLALVFLARVTLLLEPTATLSYEISIVSDVPLDKPAAPIVECRGAS